MRFYQSIANQFVFAGVVLFILNLWFFPEPKPQLGPPNPERVALQAEAIRQLQPTELTAQQLELIKRSVLLKRVLRIQRRRLKRLPLKREYLNLSLSYVDL